MKPANRVGRSEVSEGFTRSLLRTYLKSHLFSTSTWGFVSSLSRCVGSFRPSDRQFSFRHFPVPPWHETPTKGLSDAP
jgi:hypothetical protein